MASDAFFFAAVHELEAAVPAIETAGATTTTPAPTAAATTAMLATASTAALAAAARPTLPPGRIERTGLSRLTVSRVLTNATLAAGGPQLLTEGDIVDVASDFSDPRLGEGLDRLTGALGAPPLTRAQLAWLADNGDILDLDDQARGLDSADLTTFAASLRTAVNASDASAVGKLIAGEV